jgi:hypothetical protein
MTTENDSVQTIRAYLLGQLGEEEAERLDELSVTDDEYAERISAVEHDLVDAFARGELHGAILERFRSRYLARPGGREAIRFAVALQALGEHSGRGASAEIERRPTTPVREGHRWRERLALAAAVVMLAAATVWLAVDNRMLRARVTSAENTGDQLQRDQQLREVEARPPANAAPPSARQAATPLPVATLVLTPQLRSASQLPTVALTDGTGELPVQLDLEPVDYPSYNASLIAASGDGLLWRADGLIARTVGGRKTIALRLPASVLSPRDYLIRISGIPARGAAEIVGEYRFTVVSVGLP